MLKTPRAEFHYLLLGQVGPLFHNTCEHTVKMFRKCPPFCSGRQEGKTIYKDLKSETAMQNLMPPGKSNLCTPTNDGVKGDLTVVAQHLRLHRALFRKKGTKLLHCPSLYTDNISLSLGWDNLDLEPATPAGMTTFPMSMTHCSFLCKLHCLLGQFSQRKISQIAS